MSSSLASVTFVIRQSLPLPDWPEWALDVLIIMSILLCVTLAFSLVYDTNEDDPIEKGNEQNSKTKLESLASNGHGAETLATSKQQQFYAFRRKYVLVYLIIMLADWMQGTHMYTLYLSYGVNISTLFLTGFLAGAIFAPFLGSFVDKFGRKRSCIVYCVLEIMINVMEHSTNFTVLMIGRILGGVSTNLLFSAFESWMTTEHRRLGFPEEWLRHTYSVCSVGNGTMAIVAGIVAQVLEDSFGHIGPFQGAIGLTCLALVIVATGWDENYGEITSSESNKSSSSSPQSSSSIFQTFYDGWKYTVTDSGIWRIGLTQAFSEGAMYTFVFMWVPTLLSLNPPGGVPTGCMFSALMMSITIGGVLFPTLHQMVAKFIASTSISNGSCHNTSYVNEYCATLIYLVASISMAIPVFCLSSSPTSTLSGLEGFLRSLLSQYRQEWIVASFLIIEFCVGLFMPVAGTLRSKYVPDNLQGAILNIFRLPLNVIVVSGTYATDHYETSTVFRLVSSCFFLAALLQASMIVWPSTTGILNATQSQQLHSAKKTN